MIIVARQGSGASLFTSLLVNTAVNRSVEDSGRNFRYYAEPEAVNAVGKVLSSLNSGSWPTDENREAVRSVLSRSGLHFGFRTSGRFSPAVWKSSFNTVELLLQSVPIKEGATTSSVSTDASVNIRSTSAGLATPSKSGALILLLSAEALSEEQDLAQSGHDGIRDSDRFFAGLILSVALRRRRETRRLSLFIVLTKFDKANPELAAKISEGLGHGQPSDRVKSAREFVSNFFPETLSTYEQSATSNIDLDSAQLFACGIATTTDDLGTQRPKLRSAKDGTLGVDYTSAEYNSLINSLAKLSGIIGTPASSR